jgi:hypothetical protein
LWINGSNRLVFCSLVLVSGTKLIYQCKLRKNQTNIFDALVRVSRTKLADQCKTPKILSSFYGMARTNNPKPPSNRSF